MRAILISWDAVREDADIPPCRRFIRVHGLVPHKQLHCNRSMAERVLVYDGTIHNVPMYVERYWERVGCQACLDEEKKTERHA